ncbi:unnamed protein product [Prorocentrum cordatum]|uniref:Uncharacterized protein n=1 Tax=Prorocentrum cordatum TaxID=2364126 RepID=A0ABN9R698_9DINO|nr:unnamed protein product [Polarella glacialis]
MQTVFRITPQGGLQTSLRIQLQGGLQLGLQTGLPIQLLGSLRLGLRTSLQIQWLGVPRITFQNIVLRQPWSINMWFPMLQLRQILPRQFSKSRRRTLPQIDRVRHALSVKLPGTGPLPVSMQVLFVVNWSGSRDRSVVVGLRLLMYANFKWELKVRRRMIRNRGVLRVLLPEVH